MAGTNITAAHLHVWKASLKMHTPEARYYMGGLVVLGEAEAQVTTRDLSSMTRKQLFTEEALWFRTAEHLAVE